MVINFPKLVNQYLGKLPKHDYPVLNTRLFVSLWLSFALDQSLDSMQSLFKRLKFQGQSPDITTFSKAARHRSIQPFVQLYQSLLQHIKSRHSHVKSYEICPIDSTVVTLTSKLLWQLKYHQVKLFNVFSNTTNVGDEALIHFGSAHDYKFAEEITQTLSSNQVAVMDRGFASLEHLRQLHAQNRWFVLRVSLNYKLEPLETGQWKIGSQKTAGNYRLVWFSDEENKAEYRLVTNLPETVTNQEIAEIYRQRWQIELFWKFLKMHLKLDRLITKNVNGITIQIYTVLIAHLLLQLLEIPQMWGTKLLDKLRYLQACMSYEGSYAHWIERILNPNQIQPQPLAWTH
jgi:putative transposase